MAQKVRVCEVEPWRVLPHAYSATAVRCPTHGVIHRVSLDGRRMLCRQCGAATTDTAVGTVHAGKFSLDSVIEPVDGWTDEANWNGWACPLFEKDAGMQIVAKWKANGEGWVPPMRPTSTLRVPCA